MGRDKETRFEIYPGDKLEENELVDHGDEFVDDDMSELYLDSDELPEEYNGTYNPCDDLPDVKLVTPRSESKFRERLLPIIGMTVPEIKDKKENKILIRRETPPGSRYSHMFKKELEEKEEIARDEMHAIHPGDVRPNEHHSIDYVGEKAVKISESYQESLQFLRFFEECYAKKKKDKKRLEELEWKEKQRKLEEEVKKDNEKYRPYTQPPFDFVMNTSFASQYVQEELRFSWKIPVLSQIQTENEKLQKWIKVANKAWQAYVTETYGPKYEKEKMFLYIEARNIADGRTDIPVEETDNGLVSRIKRFVKGKIGISKKERQQNYPYEKGFFESVATEMEYRE